MKQHAKNVALMTLGTLLVAVGVYFFKFPNHFSTGGVSGLSVILSSFLPVPSATISAVINLVFLVLGFLILNRDFGARTVYCSLLFSLLLQGFEWLFPMAAPLTDQKLLELFFGVILPAFGAAILFNLGSSTGGTDIVALIIKKYTGMDAGRALLVSDVLIAASTLVIFDIETGLLSVLGLMLKSVVVDLAIESINRRKFFLVVTRDPEPICQFVIRTMNRSATVWKVTGAYTHQEEYIVLSALNTHQAMLLRNYLRRSDPHAFTLITNSSEIFGKGFLQA